jgi:ABC-type lipoprotein export system ATPase subunit
MPINEFDPLQFFPYLFFGNSGEGGSELMSCYSCLRESYKKQIVAKKETKQ